jgi:hypothetical protein
VKKPFKHYGVGPDHNTACGVRGKPLAMLTTDVRQVSCGKCLRQLRAMGVIPASTARKVHRDNVGDPAPLADVDFACPFDLGPHAFLVDGYSVDQYGVAVFHLRCHQCSTTVTATHPLARKS